MFNAHIILSVSREMFFDMKLVIIIYNWSWGSPLTVQQNRYKRQKCDSAP